MNHTVSVAMTVYNNSKYLKVQLESILHQTVQPDEIVICEDCSTDPDVRTILLEFQKNCPFSCRLEFNQSNLKTLRNIEKSFMLCSGDIIIHCDSDDIWEKTKVEKIKSVFMEDDVVYLFHDATVIDENSSQTYSSWMSKQLFRDNMKLDTDGFLLNTIERHMYPYGMSTAFRATLVEHIVPFHAVDDQWLALIAPLFGKVAYIDEPLVQYRRHNANQSGNGVISGKQSSIKKISETWKIKKQISKERWFDCPNGMLESFTVYSEKFGDRFSPAIQNAVNDIIAYNAMLKAAIEDDLPINICRLVKLYRSGLYQKFRGNQNRLVLDILFLI